MGKILGNWFQLSEMEISEHQPRMRAFGARSKLQVILSICFRSEESACELLIWRWKSMSF